MRLTCIQPPATEPITLEEAKFQCRVRHTQADAKLTNAIRSARQSAEQRTGRALITQTWRQVELKAGAVIHLGRWPAASVASLKVEGELVAPETYQVELGDDPIVRPISGSWCGQRVEIEFTAGYGQAQDVPQPIKDWMLAQIASLYENAGQVVIGTINSELSFIDQLLENYVVTR